MMRGVAYLESLLDRLETADGLFRQALAIYRRHGDRHGEFATLDNLGKLHLRYLDQAQGRAFMEAGLAIAAERGDPTGEESMVRNLGVYHSQIGDYPAAIARFERLLQLAYQAGQQEEIAPSHLNLGLDYWHLGLYEQAEAAYTVSLQLARQSGPQELEANVLINWALLAFCQGQMETAVTYGQQALAILQGTGWLAGYAYNAVGYGSTALGRWAEAEEALQAALAQRQAPPFLAARLETLAGLLQLAQQRGDAAAAQGYLAQILPCLNPEAVQGAEEPLRVYWWTAAALHWLGDERATAVGQEGRDLLQAQAANISDAAQRETFLNVHSSSSFIRSAGSPH